MAQWLTSAVTSQNEKTTLLGKTKQDYASIVRWMSYANTEVLCHIGNWFRPLTGRDPYNKRNVEEAQKAAYKALKPLEQHFLTHTFLVGERITLADLFAASIIARGFEFVLDKAWRDENPNTTRWYETIINQPIWKAVVPEPPMIAECIKYTPPKKETKAPKPAAPVEVAPKAEKKPKAKEVDEDEEDEPKPEVKQKHPLESLPKPTLILDDWKRKYSNEDTRSVALPWFWEHYKADEYSLWRVDYKYNEELTMTFMSSNLIGMSMTC
jgi:elongation factor 1-gamma